MGRFKVRVLPKMSASVKYLEIYCSCKLTGPPAWDSHKTGIIHQHPLSSFSIYGQFWALIRALGMQMCVSLCHLSCSLSLIRSYKSVLEQVRVYSAERACATWVGAAQYFVLLVKRPKACLSQKYLLQVKHLDILSPFVVSWSCFFV